MDAVIGELQLSPRTSMSFKPNSLTYSPFPLYCLIQENGHDNSLSNPTDSFRTIPTEDIIKNQNVHANDISVGDDNTTLPTIVWITILQMCP